jgi:hypothetical protein
MLRTGIVLAALVASASGLASPAKANVVYDITFTPNGGGTSEVGVLTLNYSSLSQLASLSPIPESAFVSFTVSGLFGKSFDLTTTADLTTFSANTNSNGDITNNLQLVNANQSPELDVTGGSYQIYGGANYQDYLGGGTLTYSAPTLGPTPLPNSWTMFALGLSVMGALTYWRRRKSIHAFRTGSTAPQGYLNLT